MNQRWMNLWYRFATPPWVLGPREHLVQLTQSGRLRPCRIDLGCGEGDNAIYLAQRGFEVSAVDFASAALNKDREKARRAGARVTFIEADLTRLEGVAGDFGLLVDYGTFDDLSARDRDRYLESVLPLCAPRSQLSMFCFEWAPHWWERALGTLLGSSGMVRPGKITARYGHAFDVEVVDRGGTGKGLFPHTVVYLMQRREQQ